MPQPAPAAATQPATPTIPTVCPPTAGTLAALNTVDDATILHLLLPHCDYRLHLVLDGDLPASVQLGDKLTGTIHARALRVDKITAGGRYVEPGNGRPRRVQGAVVGGNTSENALFVKAGPATLACTLTDPRQSLADFTLHQMVSFDIQRGASFKPKA